MTTQVLPFVMPRRWSPKRTIAYGALAVGILDGLDAVVYFGLKGVPATRIFQSVAAGLLGPAAAVAGGVPTALLGLLLHFVIACGVVSIYYLASSRLTLLTRYPVRCGILYGLLVYWIMNLIVLPLSATAGGGVPSIPVLVNGLLIHMFGVGLPTALIVTRGRTGHWLPAH